MTAQVPAPAADSMTEHLGTLGSQGNKVRAGSLRWWLPTPRKTLQGEIVENHMKKGDLDNRGRGRLRSPQDHGILYLMHCYL